MDNVNDVVSNYDAILNEINELSQGKASLVLASKTVEQSVLKELVRQRKGILLGENKVQELLSKYFTAEGLEWHFIGRLQTNKVKYIVDKVSLIQSVDSLRLAEEIEKRAGKIDKTMDILVEVNVGMEESKGGVLQEELFDLLEKIKEMPHLRLRGLMSVLPDQEETKLVPLYRRLFALYNRVKEIKAENFAVDCLSAGMSGDYKIALQNGSNMVRIGSAVFGKRNYAK